ncbi:Histidine kinase [Rhodovastum atsumiense]|uniref:histidine kinase n=1 Tax=Rhodovastum atsumiense TaxID=504468 RepID=A0A5M6IIW3_9PROT|nr:ATP-binding protein [Rhodovastum atsumiense]KAA5608183.1 hypothetical protein F1189_30290 [Rhodovastum atsumiense]CAH2602549.1 Histidine kinase [Rhodovastum atsumiense]
MTYVPTDTSRHLLNALADPAQRPRAAAALAAHWGVEAVLVLIPDHELGVLRPAPGFPATLPGGAGWRALLARCAAPGEASAEVAWPDQGHLVGCRAATGPDGSVLLLLGGEAGLTVAGLEWLGFPLLAALLRAESLAGISAARAAEARQAGARAAALATALEAARAEAAARASELARALEEADRLNRALQQLNATLEARVAARTRLLEAEMAWHREAGAEAARAGLLEAVGQLSGGVAHDFNNLLTVVLGGLDLVELGLAGDDAEATQEGLEQARDSVGRAARLVRQLLAFSRRQLLDPRPVDLNRLVAALAAPLRRVLGEAIELRPVLAEGLWLVELDAAQLEVVLLNLALNAREAMPAGGRLSIATRNTRLDAAAAGPQARPGAYVELAIGDTGCGMPPEVLAHVFEPFFTTKEVGQGTGLGLSEVHGVIAQSGGHVRLLSTPGHGTEVRIYLPRLGGDDEAEDGTEQA